MSKYFNLHPPCTPAASCIPLRCHPVMPPCRNPERCLRKTTAKGKKPCSSALSIMATRSRSKCFRCGRVKHKHSAIPVRRFLKRKDREARLRKRDRIEGTQSYVNYVRSKGTVRSSQECCAGKGHRGRLRRKGCCEIL